MTLYEAQEYFSLVEQNALHIIKVIDPNKRMTTARTADGKTALMHSRSHLMTSYLLSCNPDINTIDNEGRTALHHAVLHNNYAAAHVLVWAGANCLIRDSHGWTAVDYAIQNDRENFLPLFRHNAPEYVFDYKDGKWTCNPGSVFE